MSPRRSWLMFAFVVAALFVFITAFKEKDPDTTTPRRLELLFLGHKANEHHNSVELAGILRQEYFKNGINITFTDNPDDLNAENLAKYDGLIVYANYDTISAPQEKALLDFVKSGRGFIPLHCASFCFRNSPEVVEMIGGQFSNHKYDTFSAVITKPDHEIMKGIPAFKTKDETYVHTKFSNNINVLTQRVEGDRLEPFTWTQNFGKGRVFYTAYGHDENTFNNPGFIDLVRNGIFWAVGEEAKNHLTGLKLANPKYFDGPVPVPNYEKKDPSPQVQESLTPEQSMSLIQVPAGFDLKLFASEPQVINPIYMNWDERGRLWVIETVDYPNEVEDDDIGDDRIKILEDTDKDGKADKVTVFAEKLNIPTSFVFSNGGIIVSQSPSTLFLKDTTGDDKADIRKEILTGWGKRDTHAQSSNLHYGLDNKIWGVVGYSGYYNGKKGKDSLAFGNGVYRFDPSGKNLEYLSSTSNNTWGLGFTEDFDVFISTANNTHTAFFGMPKRYFDKAGINETGVQKLDAHYDMHTATKHLRQVDVQGGFTAAAGHEIYTARTFPKEYWNRVGFVTEPTGRLVHEVKIEQDGAGFKEVGDGWNVLTSADDWAAPIQAAVGPDGAVWITDWYDFIIQHNPTPSVNSAGVDAQNGKGNAYISPYRDHERGRIYRIVYRDGEDKQNTLSLDKNNLPELVNALSNDNMFWRTTAQRLLVEKGNTSVLPQIYKIVQDTSLDAVGINAPAIHALWTMHGLKALSGDNPTALNVALKALNHPAAGVRRAAIQVLPKTAATFNAMVKAGVFNDPDFRVRLASVLATTEMPKSNAIAQQLVNMAEKDENFSDMWLRYGLQIASKVNEAAFRAEFRKRGLNDNPSLLEATLPQRLAFGSRLSDMPLRRQFGRNASPLNPELGGNEWAIVGDMQFNAGNQGSNPRNVKPEYSGLVVAQGDRKDGYGVYFKENKMYFTVNQAGKAYEVVSSQPLPANFSFKAGLQKNGVMKLMIDNKEVGQAKTPGLFKANLDQPLRVGFDTSTGANKIADYPGTFMLARRTPFTGKLEILESIKPATTVGKVDQVINLKVVKDIMKYDKALLTAKAGTTIQIVLQNPDFMQHNLVLVKPGMKDKVGNAADRMVQDPNAAKMNYVPKMPEIIASTPLINPAGKYTLTIKLPDVPGDYPYICTFPGHWRIMNGILRVTK